MARHPIGSDPMYPSRMPMPGQSQGTYPINTAGPRTVEHAGYPIDHMQLRAYLIRNRGAACHVHVAVAILSGKKNEVVRQCYALLTVRHDFRIYMNRQLLDEAVV